MNLGKAEQNVLEPNMDTSYPGFWDDQIRLVKLYALSKFLFFSLFNFFVLLF